MTVLGYIVTISLVAVLVLMFAGGLAHCAEKLSDVNHTSGKF